MTVSGQFQAPVPLPTGKNPGSPMHLIRQWLGTRTRLEKNHLHPLDFEPHIFQIVA